MESIQPAKPLVQQTLILQRVIPKIILGTDDKYNEFDYPFLDEFYEVTDVQVDKGAYWDDEDFPSEDLAGMDLYNKIAPKLTFTLRNRVTDEIFALNYNEIPKSYHLQIQM